MTDTQQAVDDRRSRRRRGRGWRRLAWTVAIVGVLVVLVVFVLPTPLARFVVDRQLDGLGIDHEGHETVVVDLWNSRVAVGPMLLSAGESEPAQIGSVEMTYALANAFQRQALIETFTVSGVDIHVRRLADGTLEINGIRPPAAAPEDDAPAASEEEAGLPFAFGMQTLEFVDSRLVFEDITGGTLALDLARFAIADFLSWEPETPETIVLEGALNGMPFAFSGTSTLFADPIAIDIEGGLEGATVDRLAQFTGPVGLDRQAGVLATQGRHRYTLRDGAIEGTSAGTIVIEGADMATPEGDTATADRLEIGYDLAPAVAPDQTLRIEGSVDVTADTLALETAAGEAVTLARGSFGVAEMRLFKGAELRADPGETAAATPANGDAPGLLQALAQALVALGREVLRHNVEGALTPTLALEDVALRAGGQSISVGDARLEAPGLDVRAVGETWSLATPLTLQARGIDVEGPQAATVGGLELAVDALEAETDLDEARIGLDLSLEVAEVGVRGPDDLDAELARLRLATDAFEIAGRPGSGRASGALALAAEGVAASLPAADGPMTVEIAGVEVALSPFTVEETDTVAVSTAGRLDANGIQAALAGGSPVSLALAGLGVEVAAASVTPSAQSVAGDLSLAELAAEMGGEPAQRIAIARLDVVGVDADPADVVAVERVVLAGLDAELGVAAFAGGGETDGEADAGGGDGGGGAAPPPLRLGALVVEEGSRVRVIDQSVGEAVQLRFDIAGIAAGPLDTTEPATRTDFTAELSVEETATLEARGSATPLQASPDADIDLRIDGFPLPLVSPYASRLGGVTIDSGELSLTLDGSASDGALEGLLGLRVADLFLGEPSEEAAARFEEDFGVPIGFAVGILKNENGVIDFELPVSGTVAAPSVDYSEVVTAAISGAVASVFPTNWLGGDDGRLSIEPVPFDAGSAELSEDGAAVADELVQILAQKGTLRIRLCGKAAAADLATLRGLDPAAAEPLGDASQDEVNRMLELALERGRAVRAYLIERHDIAEERIGECRTSYSLDGTAPPRAEFQL